MDLNGCTSQESICGAISAYVTVHHAHNKLMRIRFLERDCLTVDCAWEGFRVKLLS